ncbi:MAG: sigma-70 family RNA polymerase sigma factor [Gammaproteobacteria bacterium]|jgi:RNA polymerase sigma-70 factor (ECF subfamily)|nr:sigma-70 family RNA polymerase sigma factor [Gammaproteobacteria bacterium]
MDGYSEKVVALYEEQSPQLVRALQRKLGNRSDAEEVVQDAFEKLLKIVQQQEIKNLHHYFFTLANHLAVDRLRHRRLETLYRQTSAIGEVEEQFDDPQRINQTKQEIMRIRKALASLPDKTRHVFLLIRFDGLTHAEVAARLGLSQKSIEYHMKQGIKAIIQKPQGDAK